MSQSIGSVLYSSARIESNPALAYLVKGDIIMLIPKKNPYVSSEISLFDMLVRAGEENSLVTLPLQFHAFLVECLVEHLCDREIVHSILAIGLLSSASELGEYGNVILKRTGDGALLLAGLFPERAIRLHVSSRYFRFIGQAAYANLGAKFQATGRADRGKFYDEVAEHFHLLERVLCAGRARPETEWNAFRRFRANIQ